MKEPFRFKNGQLVDNIPDLIEICEHFPTDAIYHLNREDFENWLDYIGEAKLAQEAKQARLAYLDDLESLEKFLASCKSSALEEYSAIAKEEETEIIVNKKESEYITFPLSQLENNSASIPLSSATRLEFSDPEEANLQPAVSPTTLQLSRSVLVDKQTDICFELPATKNTIYIGRTNEEFPVQIDLSALKDSDIISRVQAAIHLEGENFFLEDAGSANGTWLNGEKLRSGIRFRKQLRSGDEIAFGRKQSVKLTFEVVS